MPSGKHGGEDVSKILTFHQCPMAKCSGPRAGVRKKTKAEAFSECPGKGAIMAKGSVLNMLTCFFGFGFITC